VGRGKIPQGQREAAMRRDVGVQPRHLARPSLVQDEPWQAPIAPSRVVTEARRWMDGLQSQTATGHWRAINQGVMGFITVTSGASALQVSVVRGSDLSDSQADSAGSIPVTRSR
jgi:hypothetical protein